MNAPLVTVITPTYNHEAYLETCLNSVKSQTMQNWEQIVIDDGSTDGTPRILSKITDPRVRALRQANVGLLRLAETYNKALSLARGEFIAILEGDDYWPPDSLTTLVSAMRKDTVLAYGLAQLTDDVGRPIEQWIPSPSGRARLGPAVNNQPVGTALLAMASPWGKTYTFPCALLIRRTTLATLGGFQQPEGIPFVDLPTFLQLAARGPFAFVPKVTGYWRIHAASATRNRDDARITERLADHVKTVLEQYRAPLGLSDAAVAAALSAWPDHIQHVRYEQAKAHLLAHRWHAARIEFARVAREGPRQLRWRAAGGNFLARLHLPWPTAKPPGPAKKEIA